MNTSNIKYSSTISKIGFSNDLIDTEARLPFTLQRLKDMYDNDKSKFVLYYDILSFFCNVFNIVNEYDDNETPEEILLIMQNSIVNIKDIDVNSPIYIYLG